MKILKTIIAISIIISVKAYSQEYYYKDKEYYYDSHQKILKIIEIHKTRMLVSDYNSNKISKKDYEIEYKKIKKDIKEKKLRILKKYKEFSKIKERNNKNCEYSYFTNKIKEEEKFFGLWHLSYINNNKVKNLEKDLAIIDGYMLTNKLLPNLIINDCNINEIGCKTSWDFVNGNNNIYRSDYKHTYWISSIIAGKNCGNDDSSYKQIGVNPMANIYTFNVSKKINNEYKHSLRKTIEAIKKIDDMNIDIIYIPLSFQNFKEEEKRELSVAINNFINRKSGRSVISVYGNLNKVNSELESIPCSIKGVICVGGLNQYGAISNNTIENRSIDLYLPSENIIGGLDNRNERIEDNGVSASGAILTGMISKMKNEQEIIEMMNNKKLILERNGEISEKNSINF